MAVRPVFICDGENDDSHFTVKEVSVEFTWYPGFSLSQRQRSIESLHSAATAMGVSSSALEVSSRSTKALGVSLSAFNLVIPLPSHGVNSVSVETLYQGAKEFDSHLRSDNDRFRLSAREARSRAKGMHAKASLTGWRLDNLYFPPSSGTCFYDWLYLTALTHNPLLLQGILDYDCFSDIEYNPQKSLACQARSAALAKACILKDGSLNRMLSTLVLLGTTVQMNLNARPDKTRNGCHQLGLGIDQSY